jgi:hypothetical protein
MFSTMNGLMLGLYLTGEIGYTVKEKQKKYGKRAKKKRMLSN